MGSAGTEYMSLKFGPYYITSIVSKPKTHDVMTILAL